MKRNAIIRIVIFSLVIVLLLGILAAGLNIGLFIFNIALDNGENTTGSGSIEIDKTGNPIENLEIDWAAGSILVYPADVETIDIYEAGNIPEGQEMVYAVNGKTLKISYNKPSIQIGFFSTPRKDLTVVVPSGWLCHKLSIDAASADISLRNFNGITVDVNTASGTSEFHNCSISNVDIDTASGDVSYVGSLTDLDCDAASADITAVLTAMPNSISLDSASGSLDLTLPQENNGFTVEMDSLSGKFTSEFETTFEDGKYVYYHGMCAIDVDCMSGNIIIRKGT